MQMDSQANSGPVVCEVCGAYFETRRGLSSHARLHLRQLGVTVSENSGAPIELLYQLIQEKDVSLPKLTPDTAVSPPPPPKKTSQQEPKTPAKQEDAQTPSKTATKVMAAQGSPPKLKEAGASFFPSSPSSSRPTEGSSSSSDQKTITKPLWAPLETDAPITLASETNDEIHVCQLCGCWYETRKGLSSHARAHLRQIGIRESDIQGSPIEFLYQIMKEQDFEPISKLRQQELKSGSLSSPSSKRPSDFTSPPASPASKRPKTAADCTCVLCGETFENRKGLGSHARSHLRHMGVSDLVGKSSAIDTVQELVSSGVLEPMHLPKTASSSAAPSPAPPSPAAPAPSAASSHPRTSLPPTGPSPSPSTSSHSPQPPLNRAPKAKKGFRLAVDPLLRKPKPEPLETEISVPPKPSNTDSTSVIQKSPSAAVSKQPPDSGEDLRPPPTVLCDFCGQLFDTRKALSCHVRAHLRQLGLNWSIRTSPIDLLKEVMLRREERKESVQSGSSAAGKASWGLQSSKKPHRESLSFKEGASNSSAMPVDYSMKDKSPHGKPAAANLDTTCELCGFDFENRKALASHCRAHLRQLGLYEWKADGATSPIETLSELIRKDPNKVAQITKRYRYGDLYIKKSQRAASLPSTNSDAVQSSTPTASLHHHEHKASRKDHSNHIVRTARGVHAPQHGVTSAEENRHSHSRQPSRSGSIPALLPKPPLTPLVKLVGKIYSLKCRFCEEVFHGPLSVQEEWITHLQKHILSLGYKGKEAPPLPQPAASAPHAAALVHPVAV
ncbi:PREDICTED: protein Wiz-like [Cyprinodon variegatus]|uniref:WIZ zinc finger a n=1 Tax=Cyprinodon variegatus TaxID=28743 RepID=A0A3Q2CUJ9_CYPVA|nr:PREDICTED: protein Wiz-like [Cyprinodon variegatus]